jgi:hypothetical protein
MVSSKMAAQETTTSQVEECSVNTLYTTDDSLRSSRTLDKTKASSVSFNPSQDEIHEIPSARNLCKREKLERWRSDDEFESCINACKRELHELDREVPFDLLRFRGLEMVDPETCLARRKRYMHTLAAVHIEQQYQRRRGICDANGIKKANRQVSSQRMRKALENAYIDSMAVKEYLADAMLELEAEYKAKKEKEAKKSSGGFGFNSLRRTLASLSPQKRPRPPLQVAVNSLTAQSA